MLGTVVYEVKESAGGGAVSAASIVTALDEATPAELAEIQYSVSGGVAKINRRLRDAITARGGIGLVAPMSPQPTVNVGVPYAASTISGGNLVGYATIPWITQATLSVYFNTAGTNFYGPYSGTLHFVHTGVRFGICGRAGDIYLMEVRGADGKWYGVNKITVANATGYSYVWTDVTFPSYARREVRISGIFNGLAGIGITSTATIEPPPVPSLRVAHVTDSYGGMPSTAGNAGVMSEAWARLGIDVTAVSVYGETGYNASGSYTKFGDAGRLAALKALAPTLDMLAGVGGINDGTITLAADVAQYVQATRTLWGVNYVGIYGGVWCPNTATSLTVSRQKRDLILGAVQATETGPWVYIDNLAGTWTTYRGTTGRIGNGPWQTGVPNASGNGLIFHNSADLIHPLPIGVDYLGALMADGISASVDNIL
jgi:hypothetical protein